jgi:D-proline reductase (dithiol) PrdD
MERKMASNLKIKYFHLRSVRLSDSWKLTPNSLVLPKNFSFSSPLVKSFTIKLLPPGELAVATNTIMDILPVSTKVLGCLGTGITHTLTGITVILTGAIDGGEQLHEFGSSEGILANNLMLNREGTPRDSDYIILLEVLLKQRTPFTRVTCLDVFAMADNYLQPLREQLKKLDGRLADCTKIYKENRHSGKPRVVLVKQVAGQGAMYDTLLFPMEPAGFMGGLSIIDMQNMPIFLTPNECRDGALRAMV